MHQRRVCLLVASLAVGWSLLGMAIAAPEAAPLPEIVVANRYLQATGTSHAHLYLYREDGKLLRQLTDDATGQDTNPVFAPDGETIVFTRQVPRVGEQWWSVEPRGGNLHRLAAAPAWYTQARTLPGFGDAREALAPTPTPAQTVPAHSSPPVAAQAVDEPRIFDTPVPGLSVVVQAAVPPTGEDYPDDWIVRLRRQGGEPEETIGHLAGFSPRRAVCPQDGREQTSLAAGPTVLHFFITHLNSTDGDAVFALDLAAKRLVRLAQNWALPVPLPGEARLLVLGTERYVSYGDGTHSANCSFLEGWDVTDWAKVRYGRTDVPVVCQGASVYRPGLQPAVVTVLAADINRG